MQTLLYPCSWKVAEVFCRCTPNLCQGVHRLSATRWAPQPHKDIPEISAILVDILSRYPVTILIFAHSPGTIFSAAWSRENQTRPLNSLSIASSYHSFPTQRGRFQTTGFKNTYSYMFLVFQVTARRGDYRPLPPSLVTRSTKLKNPSEQPPKNQGAGGRKEQFLKIDCSMERDQHTWAFCCDR